MEGDFSEEIISDVSNDQRLTIIQKKAIHLKFVLDKDLQAADLKWSLFVAAAHCFRHDTLLKPFPFGFIKGLQKDFDGLLKVVNAVPPLDILKKQLNDFECLVKVSDVIDLLYFVLVYLKDISFCSIQNATHDEIFAKVPSRIPAAKPQHIVEVVTSESAQMKWLAARGNRSTFYAFHGTRLENLHSIIHSGLCNHFNKTSAFGTGTYLSSELSIALTYSQGGYGWGASSFGGLLSCVLLCEVIDCEHGVKKHRKEDGSRTSVPEVYYIVQNNELVRIRYILIYANASLKSSNSNFALKESSKLRQLISNNKTTAMLLGYGLLLVAVGISNNERVQDYFYDFLDRFSS